MNSFAAPSLTAAQILVIVLAGASLPAQSQAQTGQAQISQAQTGQTLAQAERKPPSTGASPEGPLRTTPDIPSAPAPQPRLDTPGGPPLGSLSLSQIIVKVEGKPNFAYVTNLDWKDGKYAIQYVTLDGATHDELIDPRTGKDTGRTPSAAPTTAPRDTQHAP